MALRPVVRSLLVCLTSFTALIASSSTGVGQSITLDITNAEHPISRHIYGHFSEHLGRCVYGGIYVGDNSTGISSRNGIRTDVVDALKQLRIPNLRWPGGCFADTYHWRDGIGPKSRRPSIVNSWWGGVTEDNSFGTHEFLELCEQLEAEPFISGNVGSGTVQELADWVQYTNSSNDSPMTRLRAENGRAEPWSVSFWGVGNEAWGCGGNMRPEYYADLYRRYATYMKARPKNKKLYRIAAGASSDDYNWTRVLMEDIPHELMEAISLHHYSVIDWDDKGPSVEYTDEQYFRTMAKALEIEELLQKHIAIMDESDPDRKIDLVVDEWGGWYDTEPELKNGVLFQQSTMRDAMIAATTLNSFNNHCDRVAMANLAQVVNVLQAVILTDEEKLILTPTFHVMQMYTVHHDATLIPTSVMSQNFEFEGEVLPALSASASIVDNSIHVSVANIDSDKSQSVVLSTGGESTTLEYAHILSSASVRDHNTFEQPNRIEPRPFQSIRSERDNLVFELPPASVIVLKLHLDD